MDFQELLIADLAELEPQAPDSLKEIAYHRLEEKLVFLEVAPGSVVTEKDLAESIGIGRTPVREAIQRLAMAGLLEVLPRRGIRVSELDSGAVLRMLEVGRGLDDAVARGAAVRAIPQQRKELQRVAEEFEAASARGDPIGLLRSDSEFNSLCISAMNNEHATKMVQLLHPLSRRFWFSRHGRGGDTKLGPRLHAQAARAVADGDPDKAAAAFRRINDYLESFIKASMYN
jgi:DNA-binding GntR family transcriptional regulator